MYFSLQNYVLRYCKTQLLKDNDRLEENSPISVDQDTEITMTFDWRLDDDTVLKNGDYTILPLNSAVSLVNDNGELKADVDGKEVVVGEYIISDGNLKVVFNEKLEDKSNRSGKVGFLFKFDLNEFNNDLESELIIKGDPDKNYLFTHNPKKGKAIDKKGSVNGKFIDYSVDINTSFEILENASFSDKIPDGLSLIEDSVQVIKLKYDVDKNIYIEGENITSKVSVDTDNKFNVSFGDIKSAYRINYRTKIESYPEDGYVNEAILSSNATEDTKSIFPIDKIKEESIIEKKGILDSENNPKKVTWTIDVNRAEASLKNVVVSDSIPDGLILENFKVYHLEYKEVDGKFIWTQGGETADFIEDQEFPLNFGTINSAYRIVVETKIDPNKIDFSADKYETEYTNNVNLEADGGYNESDSDTVTGKWDNLVIKTGEDVTNYGDRIMEWTIELNKSEFDIKGAKFVDVIGPGQELIEDSLTVNGNSLEGSSYSLEKDRDEILNEWKLDFDNIEIATEETVFGIDLGDIDDTITITYKTKIKPKSEGGLDVYEDNYKNRAYLFGWFGEGTGNGNGPSGKIPILEEHVTEGKLEISNNFSKNAVEIDYETKTFAWKLKAEAKASPFTSLTMEDEFCNQGMILVNDSIKVYKEEVTINAEGKVVINESELVEGEGKDYTLTIDSNCKFKVVFNIAEDNDIRTNYIVNFKTSFDPNEIDVSKWSTENSFENKVKFTGTNKEGGFDEDRDAKFELDKDIFNHGVKKANIDRDNRKISWSVYANNLSYNFQEKLVVTDNLSDGQSILKDTMKVFKYELAKDGSIKNKVELTVKDNISYTEDEGIIIGFTATFEDGLSHPVLFEFESKILGVSKDKYANDAVISSGDYERTYPVDVTYTDHNKFVDKKSNVAGKTAYIDSEIKWAVELNQSLSHIEKAIFKDNISAGLILVNNSIRVNGNKISEEDIEILGNHNDGTTLKITLGEISGITNITYSTVVTATTDVKVSNEAALYSNEKQLGESSKKEYTARVASWGSGSGESQGDLLIQKVTDNKEIISNNETTFKLYYYINNEEILVGGKEHTTVDGKLKFGSLPYRTYYLEELSAPKGFELDEDVKEIVLNQKEVEYSFINHHSVTDVEANKEWVNGPQDRPTVYFKLYRQIEGGELKPVDVDVLAVDNESLNVVWEELNKTDIEGNDYIYAVKEVDESGVELKLDQYDKSEVGLTVTNTYVIPTTDIKAYKEWVNGPEAKPTVYFKLYRQIEGGELKAVDADVLEVDNESLEVVWDKQDVTDIDGNHYTYSVKEVDILGNDYTPENHLKQEKGLKVTNIYESPKTSVIGRKIWVDGPVDNRPTIKLQLYRDGEALVDHTIDLENGETEYIWNDLDLTDSKGKEYVYTIDEVTTPQNYGKSRSDDGLTITNTYKSSTTDIIARKVWIDGPEERPTIELQLYRNDDEYGKPVKLVSGTYEYVWKDLDITDKDGIDYKYTVKELEVHENYQVLEEGLTVTNTYVSPKTKVVGSKVWVDGPKLKPDITLQLLRNGQEFGELITLESGNTFYTWTNLDLNDKEGIEYTYTIEELDVPDNYVASYSEDMLTVTNNYEIPKIDIVGKKVWIGGPKDKPAIKLQLLRDGEAFENPVTLEDSKVEYIWTDLEATDLEGNHYEYTIEEVDVPENYDMTISEDGLTITNTHHLQKNDLPQTGISDKSLFYGLAIISVGALFVTLENKRKKSR